MYRIWSSEVNIDDYKDYLEECFPGVTDDDEKYKIVSELNEVYLDDERIISGLTLVPKLLRWQTLGSGMGEGRGII